MKTISLLVAGSLAANAALLAVYVSQNRPAAGVPRGGHAATASAGVSGSDGKTSSSAIVDGAKPDGSTGKAWAMLNTGDVRALADRLRAAGFPYSVIRAVVGMQINESFKARRAALIPQTEDKPFWSTEPNFAFDTKYYSAIRDLSREQNKLLKDIVGENPDGTSAEVSAQQRRRFGDLPRDKIEQLQRIDQDYNELRNEVTQAAHGIMLPEDRQKLALLEQEKRADLAQTLSPSELEDYLMRTSRTTNQLRPALGLFNPSETEFRAIYAAMSPYDDKFNPQLGGPQIFTPETMRDRDEAQKEAYANVKAALGDQRYADFLRASDREFQQLNRLAQQGNVSGDAMVQAYNLRDAASKESNRIYADTTLSVDQKRAAMQSLAQSTRTQITTTLGPDVGANYLKVADRWIAGIERGSSVTFTETGQPRMKMLPNPRPVPGTAGAVVPPTR